MRVVFPTRRPRELAEPRVSVLRTEARRALRSRWRPIVGITTIRWARHHAVVLGAVPANRVDAGGGRYDPCEKEQRTASIGCTGLYARDVLEGYPPGFSEDGANE